MSKPVGADRGGSASLPSIPAKRYFTIGEVSDLCAVKPHVLRYWEQEFTQLKPVKRRGNRRYYQHHEVLLIRRIRELLYEQGFTINGARNRLDGAGAGNAARRRNAHGAPPPEAAFDALGALDAQYPHDGHDAEHAPGTALAVEPGSAAALRAELRAIRAILVPPPADASEPDDGQGSR
jgi:DNA-binding transcriptional MerR regulator